MFKQRIPTRAILYEKLNALEKRIEILERAEFNRAMEKEKGEEIEYTELKTTLQ